MNIREVKRYEVDGMTIVIKKRTGGFLFAPDYLWEAGERMGQAPTQAAAEKAAERAVARQKAND